MENQTFATPGRGPKPILGPNLIAFDELDDSETSVGGKAYALAKLSQAGFPVPAGIILTRLIDSDNHWQYLMDWWSQHNDKPLAVRSSFQAEDSGNLSFAGQNKTFLNVTSEANLRSSINKCFQSIERANTKSYQEHFNVDHSDARMNVVIQVMIEPKYSGVFFSQNPQDSGWLLEFIEGLGEDLVSGHKTPYQTSEAGISNLPADWQNDFTGQILHFGNLAKDFLKYEVDMEWAIDQYGKFFVLQARPITTQNTQVTVSNQLITTELERLKLNNSPDTTWDGQTFSEWTGFPSYLTFSLWKDAFGPNHAFGNALKKVGYLSYDSTLSLKNDSVLERVFGHVYINLDKLNKLYFGPIPYSVRTSPRPYLKFDPKKINLKTILATPYLMYRMAKVSWNLSTTRSKWLSECRKELISFKSQLQCPGEPDLYGRFSDKKLREAFLQHTEDFSRQTLFWPMVLIILVESSMSTLTALLQSVVGKEAARKLIHKWLTADIHTCTYDMNQSFREASADSSHRPFFLSSYGHRGPGELDLAHERWSELGETIFFKNTVRSTTTSKQRHDEVEQEILTMKTMKKELILQEWNQLREMLELREQWKMELLKPYAEIRYQALEIGRRNGLNQDIFWLRLSEIEESDILLTTQFADKAAQKISNRKRRFNIFRRYSFPNTFSLKQIEGYLSDSGQTDDLYFEGQGISPGAAFGTVCVVSDYSTANADSWPEDAILVAEATDPGWTPLFMKSKAVVVEKGGALSHCAIVAREMSIPAVTAIHQCHNRLKTGDKIWVDGTKGRVYHG